MTKKTNGGKKAYGVRPSYPTPSGEVSEAIANVVADAPEAFDTLKEIADWIGDDTLGTIKDLAKLRKCMTERSKILPRRVTGTCAYHQRELTSAIKRARHIALIPYVSD